MNIKNYLLLPFVALSFASANAEDPVLLTIDGKPVYKSEFEYVYNKNNSSTAIEKKSVDEYLDLFINYKLKVLDAKNEGLDQQSTYKKEFGQYKSQLAYPYLIDQKSKDKLTREAYERSKKQIQCSHILVKYDSKDSVPPFIRISEIYDDLKRGADFSEMAVKYSQCPSGPRGGTLGWVDCFSMVYPFENQIYSLKPGEFSRPFQTKFGYHIAKVTDVRPNDRMHKVSQIFISSEEPRAAIVIDSLYNLIQKGADIRKLAMKYSTDYFNGTTDGQLPWVEKNSQLLPPEVVSAIFSLSKDGEFKKYQSRIGWHIFRLDSTNLDIPYEAMKAQLEQKMFQSDRASQIGVQFRNNLVTRYGFSVDSAALAAFYPLARDKEYLDLTKEMTKLSSPLYTISDESHPQSDFFTAFAKGRQDWNSVLKKSSTDEQRREYSGFANDTLAVNYMFSKYANDLLMEKAYDDLEASNADYRNLLHEYSDGLLLFSVSSQKVWNKAPKDREGLTKYFNEHKDNYKWSTPRFRGMIVYCTTNKVKNKVDKFYAKYQSLPADSLESALKAEFNKDKKNPQISIRRGLFSKGKNAAVDYYVFKEGDSYKVEKESMPEVLVYGNETNEPKSFAEVRGAVVADYQNQLDADWIKQLREDHKVEVNQDVLKTIK